ncbi:UTP--glucose-1-phosphate uridylyltransferase [Mesobaculum littorinae]|uniref:UTP--glucose-1-phosphate uridylyltransferase n=1 Tax=Mesobaculum littorinae TaxID=2486419 RepID=A0A438ADJ3_9RHOB|nr:UTP--glucose-1-phosphate uridylyltransferase [Mesobaculum littorinae]RVV96738.1 UTP--glucose-1-phosphate uridylyltransferase [Mesobaculum littorinae]
MTKSAIKTAIFPVAGLGTRFLPATKATPKELLPVIDTPLIQYAIDEAREAGIEKLIFVNHPSKSAIERHIRHDAELHSTLNERGKGDIAEDLHRAAIHEGEQEIVFVMQEEPLGLGHAVLCARDEVLPGAVAVILPDDLMLGEPGCLTQMAQAYAKTKAGHMVAAMDVDQERVSSYGVLDATHTDGPLTFAKGMVEKPKPEEAPSTKAVVGRYVLDGSIFDDLAVQEPGAGGEIQLTDAIAAGIERVGLVGFSFSGRRFDCGSKQGMLAATLTLASEDPDYADVLAEFCGNLGGTRSAA